MNLHNRLRSRALYVIAILSTLILTVTNAQPVTVNYLGEFGSGGSAAQQFTQPLGITVNRLSGIFTIADFGNGRVQQFNAQGVFQSQWSTQGNLVGAAVSRPLDVAVNELTGSFIFVEREYHCFQQFDYEGDFVRKVGDLLNLPGSGASQFNFPSGVAIHQSNANIYISDRDNNRVQYFSNSGAFLGSWGSQGTGVGQFNSPGAMAIHTDAGQIFVVDRGNNRIQRFNLTGIFQTSWGSPGTAAGQFQSPNGIAIAPDGLVLVADLNNRRVQVFDSNGVYKTQFNPPGPNATPYGVAVHTNGIVFVSDILRNTISRWQIVSNASDSPPTIRIKGPKSVRTKRGRHVLRGTAADDRALAAIAVRVKGTREKLLPGTTAWRVSVRLKKKNTKVLLQAIDDAGQRSPSVRVTILRR